MSENIAALARPDLAKYLVAYQDMRRTVSQPWGSTPGWESLDGRALADWRKLAEEGSVDLVQQRVEVEPGNMDGWRNIFLLFAIPRHGHQN